MKKDEECDTILEERSRETTPPKKYAVKMFQPQNEQMKALQGKLKQVTEQQAKIIDAIKTQGANADVRLFQALEKQSNITKQIVDQIGKLQTQQQDNPIRQITIPAMNSGQMKGFTSAVNDDAKARQKVHYLKNL